MDKNIAKSFGDVYCKINDKDKKLENVVSFQPVTNLEETITIAENAQLAVTCSCFRYKKTRNDSNWWRWLTLLHKKTSSDYGKKNYLLYRKFSINDIFLSQKGPEPFNLWQNGIKVLSSKWLMKRDRTSYLAFLYNFNPHSRQTISSISKHGIQWTALNL